MLTVYFWLTFGFSASGYCRAGCICFWILLTCPFCSSTLSVLFWSASWVLFAFALISSLCLLSFFRVGFMCLILMSLPRVVNALLRPHSVITHFAPWNLFGGFHALKCQTPIFGETRATVCVSCFDQIRSLSWDPVSDLWFYFLFFFKTYIRTRPYIRFAGVRGSPARCL